MKYIVITGGVISGVGKGIVSSSIGLLLKARGFNVTCIKIDPYLNVDAGTIRPYDHGEVFVLDDGGECDLDLGSYERFLDITLTSNHNITSGKIFKKVIEKERKGDYLGKTVQMIPHVTDQIIEDIENTASIPVDGTQNPPEICIIELGGTIGDLESNIFVQALKRLKFKLNGNQLMSIHVSKIIETGTEQKTKPTQKSIEELGKLGLPADLLICRAKEMINDETRRKLDIFCNIPVVSVKNCETVYHVPPLLEDQDIFISILEFLNLPISPEKNHHYTRLLSFIEKIETAKEEINIALVGKYTKISDSYLSVIKALEHACYNQGFKLNLKMVNAEENVSLEDIHGIIVPGGFGKRGTDGIMNYIRYARENNIPFLGICYGFQLAIVEFLRNRWGVDTTSQEIDDTDLENACIKIMETDSENLGGTMKLGSHPILSMDSGEEKIIHERFRHRYEYNNKYTMYLGQGRFDPIAVYAGKLSQPTTFKLKTHPYFVCTQFHPEFKTRFFKPHLIFSDFINACKINKKN